MSKGTGHIDFTCNHISARQYYHTLTDTRKLRQQDKDACMHEMTLIVQLKSVGAKISVFLHTYALTQSPVMCHRPCVNQMVGIYKSLLSKYLTSPVIRTAYVATQTEIHTHTI